MCVHVCICVCVCDTVYASVRGFVLIYFPAFMRASVRVCILCLFLTAVVRDVSPSSCPSAVSDRPLGCVARPGDGPRGTN